MEAEQLRARVAELEREVERVRAVSDSMARKIREAAEVIHAHEAEARKLQAEVDACGEIIGQPPGASRGHAEIIAATIARHQEHGEQLAARVAEMEREVEQEKARADAFESLAWDLRDLSEDGVRPDVIVEKFLRDLAAIRALGEQHGTGEGGGGR